MNIRIFSYLLSILVFAVPPVLLLFKEANFTLKKYKKVVLIIVLIGIPQTFTEVFALRWGAWSYVPGHTLEIRVGPAVLESFIFLMFVGFAIASATLLFSEHEDAKKH